MAPYTEAAWARPVLPATVWGQAPPGHFSVFPGPFLAGVRPFNMPVFSSLDCLARVLGAAILGAKSTQLPGLSAH